MARFARSFALSIRSGVPIVQALTVVSQTVDNAYLAHAHRADARRRRARRKHPAHRHQRQRVHADRAADDRRGRGTGSLDDLMDEIALMYEREVDYELKTLSSQIEPILITFLGVMVLVLALGIFLPIWDLGKAALHDYCLAQSSVLLPG
jgi:MSHA biogenesis protein MshG